MTSKHQTDSARGGSQQRLGSASDYVLTYAALQQIHKLTSMVCGWKMSLPTEMIKQAQVVHNLMLELEIPKPPKGMQHTRTDVINGHAVHCYIEDK